jgi:hypothetical protein
MFFMFSTLPFRERVCPDQLDSSIKSDDYEFRTPFYYDNARSDQPLCPKCFAKNIPAPMGEPGQGCSTDYRRCLVSENCIEVNRHLRQMPRTPRY